MRMYSTNVVKNKSATKVWTQWLHTNTHIQGGDWVWVCRTEKCSSKLAMICKRQRPDWTKKGRRSQWRRETKRWNLRIIMHSNNKSSFYIKTLHVKIWKTDLWGAIYYYAMLELHQSKPSSSKKVTMMELFLFFLLRLNIGEWHVCTN